MSNNIHIGDVGTVLRVRIIDDVTGSPIDISSAIVKKIRFKKSNGVIFIKDAVLTGDGTDGYMQYVTLPNDLNVTGTWTLQGYVSSSTYENHSELMTFEVKENI